MTRLVASLRFVSLLFGGLYAGFLLSVMVIELTLRNFEASVYTLVQHVKHEWLDELAIATIFPTMVAAVTLVVFGAKGKAGAVWPTLAAVVLLIVALVTTLTVNVPINTDQLTWDVQAPPADWASVRDRWQVAHAVRTVAAILAFGFLIVAEMHSARDIRRMHSR